MKMRKDQIVVDLKNSTILADQHFAAAQKYFSNILIVTNEPMPKVTKSDIKKDEKWQN